MNSATLKLRDQITPQIGRELALVIGESVVETIEVMFGQKITVDEIFAVLPDQRVIAANMLLKQGHDSARLRMLFDRNLVLRLVSGFYPREMLENDGVLQDAACEIANIVCNRVKLYLNSKGLNISLGIPYADSDDAAQSDHDIINLHFSSAAEREDVGSCLRIDFSLPQRA